MINLILMKKFFNIATTLNKIMFIKIMKLCLQSAAVIKEVLYAVECS